MLGGGVTQRAVLWLEPSRATATVIYSVIGLIAGGFAAVAVAYRADALPVEWRPSTEIDDRVVGWVALGVTVLALACAAAAIVNGRRWRAASVVRRLSEDHRLGPGLFAMGGTLSTPPRQRVAAVPHLEVVYPSPPRLRRRYSERSAPSET